MASELEQYAWYKDTSGNSPRAVGRKAPNPWGLYDVYGNVWEWCANWYSHQEKEKVLRGGSYTTKAEDISSSLGARTVPDICHPEIGFRLVMTPLP